MPVRDTRHRRRSAGAISSGWTLSTMAWAHGVHTDQARPRFRAFSAMTLRQRRYRRRRPAVRSNSSSASRTVPGSAPVLVDGSGSGMGVKSITVLPGQARAPPPPACTSVTFRPGCPSGAVRRDTDPRARRDARESPRVRRRSWCVRSPWRAGPGRSSISAGNRIASIVGLQQAPDKHNPPLDTGVHRGSPWSYRGAGCRPARHPARSRQGSFGDGTTHVVLDPIDFIARLAALVPRP